MLDFSPEGASRSEDGVDDDLLQTKKRKSNRTALPSFTRRALSCTECKRRKTKCSALGVVPCDSCIKRRRPEDCRWDDGPGRQPAPASIDSSTQLHQLQVEVKELRQLLTAHLTVVNSTCPEDALSRAHPGNPASQTQSQTALVRQDSRDALDETMDALEDSVVGLQPGTRLKRLNLDDRSSVNAIYDGVLLGLEPGSIAGKWLLQAYFNGPVHKGWKALTYTVFMNQYDLLAMLSCDNQRIVVDHVWLAQYIMVALLYIVSLFHFGGSHEQANLACRHLDSAITTAQWLGLDNIDNNAGALPYDDTALHSLPSWAAVEVCKQLYHTLAFIDGTIARNGSRFRFTDETTYMTSLPLNYNDIDLQRQNPPPERPQTEFTEATLSRIGSRFAAVIRRHTRNRHPGTTHRALIDYDSDLRNVLNDLSWTAEEMATGSKDEQVSWMMPLLFCSIHNRLLRLHRPRLLMGHSAQGGFTSRAQTVESAMRIIECQSICSRNLVLRPGFSRRWILGAALVLTIDVILGSAPANIAESSLALKCEEGISRAREIFRRFTPVDTQPSLTQECSVVVEALISSLKSSSTLLGVYTPIQAAAHLQRVFGDIRSASKSDYSANQSSSAYPASLGLNSGTFDSEYDWLMDFSVDVGEGLEAPVVAWDGATLPVTLPADNSWA